MSMNSSLSSNDSILHTFMDLPPSVSCMFSKPGSYVFTMYIITNVSLLLPSCIFIFYHGFQQWHQKLSASSAAGVSHTDCFTYHMVAMEMFVVFGCILCCCGIYIYRPNTLLAGVLLSCLAWHGEILFNVLMCVERYLAVVHPVTYLSLRSERGIRIRNISVCCVWLLSLAEMFLMTVQELFITVDFCILILALTVASFCSVSVLWVLIRPGPGEPGRGRERVDPSKQRAFYTILAILGVLVLRFSWGLARAALVVLEANKQCLIVIAGFWCYLPSSLVLPLLFLLRTRKLLCSKRASNQVKG